ncbi:MAG: hypothetical protein JWR37_1842 [Mycobacterium sp.]|nr:hypothetical protein [Mycobacterium sp.]
MTGADWPFVGSEALEAGVLNRYQLGVRYDAVFRNVCIPRGAQLTPVTKARAAWLWSGREATVAGLSAAALHGSLWIDPHLPAELNHRSRHKTRGILLHSDVLTEDERCRARGILATTPARTAFDVGRRTLLTTAVIRLDALMRATHLKPADVESLIDRHRGARGIVGLREALRLCDGGAESPQETRTRLVLVSSGLPPPRTQIEIFDAYGNFVARLDMGWEEFRVGVEFDGAQHWTDAAQRSRDIDRLAELEALGWTIVRVSAEMLRDRPGTVVARVRAALSRRT